MDRFDKVPQTSVRRQSAEARWQGECRGPNEEETTGVASLLTGGLSWFHSPPKPPNINGGLAVPTTPMNRGTPWQGMSRVAPVPAHHLSLGILAILAQQEKLRTFLDPCICEGWDALTGATCQKTATGATQSTFSLGNGVPFSLGCDKRKYSLVLRPAGVETPAVKTKCPENSTAPRAEFAGTSHSATAAGEENICLSIVSKIGGVGGKSSRRKKFQRKLLARKQARCFLKLCAQKLADRKQLLEHE